MLIFYLCLSQILSQKINISLEEINVSQLNKLSKIIKPSTFKSFLNNKIQKGKVISEIEVFLDNKGELKNYIAKGEVKNLKAELKNNLNLSKTSFNFFADKDDILIKNIFGEIENVKISDGDMKLNFENEIIINSNFTSKIFFDEKTVNKFSKYFFKSNLLTTIKNLDAELNNNFSITFDKTYKVKEYNYSNSGKFKKGKLVLPKLIKNEYLLKEIKEIYFSNLQIVSVLTQKNHQLKERENIHLITLIF